MSDTHQKKSHSDNIWDEEISPNIIAMLREIIACQKEMQNTLKQQSRAFVQNEFHEPDYDGHRREHIEIQKSAEMLTEYKIDATKKVIGFIIVFMLGAIATGLLTYIKRGL